MMPSFELDAPDYFTVGTLGPPGERVFYLQGREAGTVVTLRAEKEQVRALAEYVAGVLAKLSPLKTPAAVDLPLLEPVTPAWAVGSLGLGYDEGEDRIVIVANAVKEGDEEEDAGEDEKDEADTETADTETAAAARFSITRTQAASFVERARALMRSGRPTCPMCSAPIDPGGHVCPRANGHAVARK